MADISHMHHHRAVHVSAGHWSLLLWPSSLHLRCEDSETSSGRERDRESEEESIREREWYGDLLLGGCCEVLSVRSVSLGSELLA